ncbi:MAG: EAL domain-containing protein, partial [Oscillospiraceae bacterium]|nr:EAL domain-containing protein [Oscillospiraceae bacterium]
MNITNEIVREVIENKDIYVEFQPIYSLNTKKVIGLEALARGDYMGEIVSPYFLFNYAKKDSSILYVDRLCREKAMCAYAEERSDAMLYVNFETSVLNDVIPGNGEILRTAAEYGIAPENIVIELNESNVKDSYNLLRFVDFYRSNNFLIALD